MRKATTAIVLSLVLGAISIAFAIESQNAAQNDLLLRHFPIDRTLTYQGILKDNSGHAVPDANYNLTFRLYDQPTGGALLWTSSLTQVATINGAFIAQIGPISLPFDTTYFLSLQVQSDPEMATRQKMTMSPYSASSDTANFAFKSDTSGVSQNVVDNSITTAKIINGTILFQDIAQNSATNGQVMKWNGSAWVARNDSVGGGSGNGWTDDGSRVRLSNSSDSVGIGTSSPTAKLEVSGPLRIDGKANIGSSNSNSGNYSSVLGGQQNAVTGDYSAIGSGASDTVNSAYGALLGGYLNKVGYTSWDTGSFIGGGFNNLAESPFATIVGGRQNGAHWMGFVGGGSGNYAGIAYSTIPGGENNNASQQWATIGGGKNNTILGSASTISGGTGNYIEAGTCAIPGGTDDSIGSSGSNSMVFGFNVYCNSSQYVVLYNGLDHGQLSINRDGRNGLLNYPITVGTNTANGNGAYLTNGGVWTNGSSRTFKENFTPFDSNELLSKIANLSITTWNYKQSTEKHVGPVAEDFVGAFDTGVLRENDGKRDDQYLAASDVAGVALAGVQELMKKIDELQQKNAELEKRISELEHR